MVAPVGKQNFMCAGDEIQHLGSGLPVLPEKEDRQDFGMVFINAYGNKPSGTNSDQNPGRIGGPLPIAPHAVNPKIKWEAGFPAS